MLALRMFIDRQLIMSFAVGSIFSAVGFVVSVFIIGPSMAYVLGAILGLASGAVSVLLLKMMSILAIERRKAIISPLGMLLRAILFGGIFYVSYVFMGYAGCAGCAVGFISPYIGVCISAALAQRKKHARSRQRTITTYVTDAYGRRRFLLIRKYDMTKYRGERRYVTHRSFRRLVAKEDADA